ncbi:MAG: hypothetical protein KI788_21805, partial [Mameliella sp.]|nr:hypothetical protein [Mameliella sp.]
GDLQRRLDVVIRGYVGSDQYRDLARQWMEDPVFWTDRRVNLILYGGGALAILGALAFLIQNWRARANAERLRAQTALASERLAAILASTRQGSSALAPAERWLSSTRAVGCCWDWRGTSHRNIGPRARSSLNRSAPSLSIPGGTRFSASFVAK